MRKQILILDAHPDPESFTAALAQAYGSGARAAGHDVRILAVRDLHFDPTLHCGYRQPQPLEPDLVEAQRLLTWAHHVCVLTPVWWGSVPALFKGFCDRTLLPGFGFRYHEGKAAERLLRGRTGRMVVTSDAPTWYLQFVVGDPAVKALGRCTLGLCGFRPLRVSRLGSIRQSSPEQRKRWLFAVQSLGQKGI